MAISQKIVQKQGQTLAFTAQMRQAIELLELSNLDLQTYVNQQLLENPFLEGERHDSEQDNQSSSEHEIPSPSQSTEEGEKEKLYEEMGSENYDNVWSSDRRLSSKHDRNTSNIHDLQKFEDIAAEGITLRDHLLSQINTDIDNEQDRLIAFALLEALDETGYLTTPLDKITEALGANNTDVERVLEHLKRCDPVGVFASSLRECLSLQLDDLGLLDQKARTILDYIDLFAEAKIQDLLNKAGCSAQDLKSFIEQLRRLDPKPGLKFQQNLVQTLIPDVFVYRERSNESTSSSPWIVALNAETLPKVLVTQDYKIRAGLNLKKDKELRKYYQERMGEANWLVRALDQRAQNILKVVEEIIHQQQAFFEKGVTALKPLNLRQVADAIGVHESTVSRITQNKYMNSPRGTFELRYFFSASITNAWTGEDQSALQIQHKIQELIKNESPQKPLSDDALVLKLSEHNFDIARRTISKYRELLKIPSSYERKRRHIRGL
ncbi:MAG TPA: RNA polymerase sigma-54 factor [Holosporales bacterium]|nr:RNA polymerase sigma-54 factor [Holosporales bacterium]